MADKPQTILIVEDEHSLNQVYRLILRSEGYNVVSAFNGEEALKLASEHEPDLILLDLRMPHMDGNSFLRKYDLKRHAGVRVVVFSNYDMQHEIDEAYRQGVDRYILKALASPKELVKIVNNTLQKVKG